MIALTSLLGTLICLALALVGARTLWGWVSAGYQLEQKQLHLGEHCLREADEVLSEVKVPVLPMRVK